MATVLVPLVEGNAGRHLLTRVLRIDGLLRTATELLMATELS
jgi:hypothetical protein